MCRSRCHSQNVFYEGFGFLKKDTIGSMPEDPAEKANNLIQIRIESRKEQLPSKTYFTMIKFRGTYVASKVNPNLTQMKYFSTGLDFWLLCHDRIFFLLHSLLA